MSDLPVVGAAMPIADLATHRDFLLELPRDLEIQDFTKASVLSSDYSGLIAEAKKQLDGHEGRVGIHGPFWGFAIDTADPDIRTVVQTRMNQGLDACVALHATHMVIHSPYTTWFDFNRFNYPNADAVVRDAVHETLRPIVVRAEQEGVTLVLENIEDRDPELRVQLAASFNSEAVKVSLDTGHAHYAHGSTGAPPVDYFIAVAGDALAHVHLQDAEGHADRHWSLGQGTIRWHAVFRALSKLNSNPRLILELKDTSEIPASLSYLKAEGLAR